MLVLLLLCGNNLRSISSAQIVVWLRSMNVRRCMAYKADLRGGGASFYKDFCEANFVYKVWCYKKIILKKKFFGKKLPSWCWLPEIWEIVLNSQATYLLHSQQELQNYLMTVAPLSLLLVSYSLTAHCIEAR